MINTLIIDDSSMVRDILRDFLEGDENFHIIGEASDGREGVEKILSLNPDLVTLDLEMPRMNGLAVIEAVMKQVSVPIVVITSNDTAKIAYEATLRGALEFYPKDLFTANLSMDKRKEIYETLKRISGVKSRQIPETAEPVSSFPQEPEKRSIGAVVMASSTGGPKALSKFYSLMPGDFPAPIILVQHNSPGFDDSFAQWLDTFTALKVKLAIEGDRPAPGVIYVAQTGRHLELCKDAQGLILKYNDNEQENNQKPAADVLFRTAAESLGRSLISIVLTGMGSDGAAGTRIIHGVGGITLAQDKDSSLIYGMPKAAADTGCVNIVLPLEEIPGEVIRLVK